jgi:prephenate dehydrogenase
MNIAIYGLGLIGGSIGRAAAAKTEHKIYGCDTDRQAVLKAEMMNAVHGELTDGILKTCDLVIFAVCPRTVVKIMPEICGKLKDGATVIDCCGVKRAVIAEMERLHGIYKNLDFVGVHPMAGREFCGVEHSTAGLYEHSFAIIIPVHDSISAIEKVKKFFTELGCEGVEISDAKKHDRIISYTSQLAHAVSCAYIKNPLSKEHAGYSAGSFRDMTRVARLNPDMWTELFTENADNLISQINDLEKHLDEIKDALEKKDETALKKLLAEGAEAKAVAENALRERRKNENG